MGSTWLEIPCMRSAFQFKELKAMLWDYKIMSLIFARSFSNYFNCGTLQITSYPFISGQFGTHTKNKWSLCYTTKLPLKFMLVLIWQTHWPKHLGFSRACQSKIVAASEVITKQTNSTANCCAICFQWLLFYINPIRPLNKTQHHRG